MKEHRYEDLIALFNECFTEKYNVLLEKGEAEPLYLPADAERPHNVIYFAHGFFSSALHECSHWLVAGLARHKLIDFGYWYQPDGRTTEQQQLFEQVEVKSQALEWILSVAANHRFRVSIDNLSGEETDPTPFKTAVYQQVMKYAELGLNDRAETFRTALSHFYQTDNFINLTKFNQETI